MKYHVLMSLLLTSALLGGCATNSGFKTIHPSVKDKLTEGTKKQILEHNEFCVKQGNCTTPEN